MGSFSLFSAARVIQPFTFTQPATGPTKTSIAMKVALIATVLGSLAASVNGYVVEAEDASLEALANLRRALPNSPKGYTPSRVTCPQNAPSVRAATSLSANETAWLEKRRNNTLTPMRNLLNRLDIGNFNASEYIENHSHNASALPNIGIAVSGGGWLVGSLFMNNFTTVGALQADTSGSVWEFGNSVLKGPDTGGLQIFDTAEYYANLASDVNGKDDAGFDVSLTDVWGRALSFQLVVYLPNSPYVTFSNESTFTFSANNSYRDAIILNGQDVATMGNGTVDDTWPTCVGCAILSRSLDRTGTDVPEVCQQCFNRFCWNGTVDSSTPEPYEPTPILAQLDISSKGSTSLFSRWTAAAAAAIALASTL